MLFKLSPTKMMRTLEIIWLTLLRCHTMPLIAVHLISHSLPKSKFQEILVENTTIKPQLRIPEALHIKTKKPIINRINFENSDNVLECL